MLKKLAGLLAATWLASLTFTAIEWSEYQDAAQAHSRWRSELIELIKLDNIEARKEHLEKRDSLPDAEAPWILTLTTAVVTILFGTSVIVLLKPQSTAR